MSEQADCTGTDADGAAVDDNQSLHLRQHEPEVEVGPDEPAPDHAAPTDQAMSLRDLAAEAANLRLPDLEQQPSLRESPRVQRAPTTGDTHRPDSPQRCSKCRTMVETWRPIPCQHVICEPCMNATSPGVECPECSGMCTPPTCTTPVSGSPKKSPKGELCRECRKGRVRGFCSHCNSQLCDTCQGAHIVQVANKLKDLQLETKVLLPKTFGIIEKCGEKLITAHYKVTAVLSDIERVSDLMVTALQARCSQLKAEVVREANTHNEARAEFQRDLSSHLVHLQSFLSDSPAFESVTPDNIAACEQYCEQWMEEVISAENTTSAPQKYSIDFSADKDFLKDVCSTYGTVEINKKANREPDAVATVHYIPINYYSKAKAQMEIGSKGMEGGKFADPSFIAVAPNSGNLFVTDRENNRVKIFQENGQFVTEFGHTGDAAGQFKFGPWIDAGGLAFNAAKGMIIVADTGNHRIQLFGERGRVTRVFGRHGSEPGQFQTPRGVATDSQDRIYVSDTGNHRVQILDHNGTVLQVFGTKSTMGSWKPSGIAVHPDGDIIVADSRGQLQVFSPNGQHKTTLGLPRDGFPGLRCPCGVTVDHYGNIIVTDYLTHAIHIFGQEGEFVCSFGSDEPESGLVGVAWTPSGKIVVVDQISHRLRIY